MTEEEVARRVEELLAGLCRLAVEVGYRWDGERWVWPEEGGCGVACGAGAGLECGPGVPFLAPLGTRTGLVPVSHGAPKPVSCFPPVSDVLPGGGAP